MKKILLTSIVTVFLTLGMMSIINLKTTDAQGRSFNGVYPFVSTVGDIGFFDQNTGMIYLYDSDLNECIFQAQLSELGSGARSIKSYYNKPQGTY